MAESFPLDAAQVVALYMESVFYGIFLVSFFWCLRTLLWLDGRFKSFWAVNKMMLFAALLMFMFASLDSAFHLRHNLEAFVHYEGDPIDEFQRTSYWLNVVKMGCYVAQTFVGDSILIYRCWIVYNRNWLAPLLPFLFWLGTSVCGAMTIYVEATLDANNQSLNSNDLIPFITSMLCLTLATNATATSLIVYRIWGVRKSARRASGVLEPSPLTNVLVVLIESGLLYTISIIILFGLYMASNNAQYGVSNAVVQIIGITFNLVITSVDRRGATVLVTSQSGPIRSFRSPQNSTPSVPLSMVNIQTTITRYPDYPPRRMEPSDPEESFKTEWNSRI